MFKRAESVWIAAASPQLYTFAPEAAQNIYHTISFRERKTAHDFSR